MARPLAPVKGLPGLQGQLECINRDTYILGRVFH
jgi:hypothetical protein